MTNFQESKIQILWQGIIFLAVFYTVVEVPATFVLNVEIEPWQLWMDGIISFIFALDIYFNFIYFPKLDAELDRKERFRTHHRFTHGKRWLFIDIVCAIPFDLIAVFIGQLTGTVQLIKILRLSRTIRLIRVIKLYEMRRNFTVMPRSMNLFLIVAFSLMIINAVACGWMWIYPHNGTEDLTTFYVKGVYWAITTLTTIGYGDITPTTNIGRIYTMLIMILGVGVYGIVIGNVSKIFVEASRHKQAGQEKLMDLTLYMKHYRVPLILQKQVFNFYNHLIQKRMSDNDHTLISDLPTALQKDLKVYMNIQLISNVPAFRDCPINCLKGLSASLEQIYYSPRDYVIKKGELGKEMYIIGHGIVDILDDEGHQIATLRDGQCFGEMALLEETTRSHDIRAEGYCDIYKLDKEKFDKIVGKFPNMKNKIEETLYEILAENKKEA